MKLRISDDLTLPLEFVTQTQAILARKRVGKSYTASVQAEEMLKAKQQVIVIDYTGAWWGLRAGRDGKAEGGYPIHVFGGDHADVPLEEKAGEVIAAAAVRERFSAILDLSHFRKGEALRFLSPFLETLYRQNREPLHLFADECDAYAPQRLMSGRGEDGGAARALGAMNDIVRRGGIRGIGCTLISQRPAVINKDILTMCGVLTCLRISHPKDIAPVREWIELHDVDDRADEMIASLPSLPIGTAWMWAPGWPSDPGIFKRIQIRQRETFDSGATPKPGESVKVPKVLRTVDLVKLGDDIRATVEKAKANDPSELRRKISELEKKLAGRPAETREVEKIVEVPVLKNGQLDRTERILGRLEDAGGKLMTEAAELRRLIAPASAPRPAAKPVQVARPLPAPRQPRPAAAASENGTLAKGERIVLTAIAQHADGTSPEQLTVLTGYKRSTRDAYLQRLREKGYIDRSGDDVIATDEGVSALGAGFEPLPTGDALREHWMEKLPDGERRVLDVLVGVYPKPLDREQLDEPTGFKRSTRDAYLQRLMSRRLVEGVGRGEVKASDVLFG